LPAALALASVGCGDEGETHRMLPQQLAMTEDVAPIYDDGETAIYEVRLPVLLPIAAPSEQDRQALSQRNAPPFPRAPYIEPADVAIQISWTLANLDADEEHDVTILVDPWNEFGRYYPGIVVEDDEAIPQLSGIEITRVVPAVRDKESSSRIHGSFSFDDMEELATDFATVINIFENPPAAEGEEDPRAGLVNYTFNVENRFDEDLSATKQFLTPVVPGLIGFDIGLRTGAPANIAIEFSVELIDYTGHDVVLEEDDEETDRIREPDQLYTLGSAM
jgi:hypothetical protein